MHITANTDIYTYLLTPHILIHICIYIYILYYIYIYVHIYIYLYIISSSNVLQLNSLNSA